MQKLSEILPAKSNEKFVIFYKKIQVYLKKY
jgi:hypothetical protein